MLRNGSFINNLLYVPNPHIFRVHQPTKLGLIVRDDLAVDLRTLQSITLRPLIGSSGAQVEIMDYDPKFNRWVTCEDLDKRIWKSLRKAPLRNSYFAINNEWATSCPIVECELYEFPINYGHSVGRISIDVSQAFCMKHLLVTYNEGFVMAPELFQLLRDELVLPYWYVYDLLEGRAISAWEGG